jgi:hypothetical protein
MRADTLLLAALPAIAGFIALPAFAALCRRRATREASEVAVALAEIAAASRRDPERGDPCALLDANLNARMQRLRVPELASLQLVQELAQARPELVADTAHRLALRLKRRIAFERKMLARTASGRRRGALAAIVPPLLLLVLNAFGIAAPLEMLTFVICLEAFGCWLLWRLARVSI